MVPPTPPAPSAGGLATSGAPSPRARLWIPCALLSGAGFVLSPEAGLAAGVAALGAVFLFSSRRERDIGLLLLVLGSGILVSARSFYPGMGTLLGGLYLLARSRWGPSAPVAGAIPSREKRRRVGGTEALLGNQTLYELATALGAVALVVALLQQGTATWPAMVAVESCSMEPNIRVGDLVLVAGPSRSSVTTQEGQRVEFRKEPSVPGSSKGGWSAFSMERGAGEHPGFALTSGCTLRQPGRDGGCAERGESLSGDVIVFYPNGNTACTPIIHRARTWVAGNSSYGGRTFVEGGFITKGDNNGPLPGGAPVQASDQIARGANDFCPNTEPVQPEWMVGVAKFRIPWLGYVRLLLNPSNWPKNCADGL